MFLDINKQIVGKCDNIEQIDYTSDEHSIGEDYKPVYVTCITSIVLYRIYNGRQYRRREIRISY